MGPSTEVEILIGICEIAVAIAGFSGVVVVFGSRGEHGWHPGDRLRLGFLLESSLTAGALSLLAVIALSLIENRQTAWTVASAAWASVMVVSLFSSSRRLQVARAEHPDIDEFANRVMFVVFAVLIMVELANAVEWRAFGPVLVGLVMNLVGACTQFGRLIRSAFHD